MNFINKECSVSFIIWFIAILIFPHLCSCTKLRYASDTFCDRHSLDAVYHDKYKLITNNIFADTREFVSRVSDLVSDSLTTVLANLPDRDVSSNEEKRIFTQFKNVKSAFFSRVKKIHNNITSSWEDLVTSHFDLMFDNGKCTLEDYLNKTLRATDSYSEARKTLDKLLSSFIDVIKSTIWDGFKGIKVSSEAAIEKEDEERKKNQTEGLPVEDVENKSKVERIQAKMTDITKMIVPGFLGKATLEIIQRKMDLSIKSDIKPENRDSVLDDIVFDMAMVKSRIRAIIQTDIPRDKGATDLARRSIYTYWADVAEQMYKEKIAVKKSKDKSHQTGRLYYRNLWKDEDQIVDTLLNLMEVYP